MRDELESNFQRALVWCISNEVHLDNYQELISVDIAPVLDLSVLVTEACAKRLGLVNERPLENGGPSRWADDDGIKICWIDEEAMR